MNFTKYNSIENSYREKTVIPLLQNPMTENWVVTEKVHGANFSFWCDGGEVKCAKRSGFIKVGEDFFNFETIWKNHVEAVFAIFDFFDQESDEIIKEVVVFGELFGGSYKGETEGKKVQKEVEYIPHNDFIAFDIKVNDTWLDFTLVQEVCKHVEIKCVPVLMRGTLKECLDFSPEFITQIPDMYGLEEIEGNFSEGVVIRPDESLFDRFGNRVLLKNKNEKFAEKKDTGKRKIEVPQNVIDISHKMLQYVNDNRVDSAISKIGNERRFFSDILKECVNDILQDYSKENEDYETLEKQQQNSINKMLSKEVATILKVKL